MNKAIELAKANGWKQQIPMFVLNSTVISNPDLLDPKFFQALGKACGWYPYPNMRSEDYPGVTIGEWKEHNWHHYWHKLIDHIAKGKDADSFFNELLK